MAETPKDRSPLIVQPDWEDWDKFAGHLQADRANDNNAGPAWRRDFEGQPERKAGPANPEIDQVLSGLLKPETYAEELRRRAREQGRELRDGAPGQERDQDRSDDLERW